MLEQGIHYTTVLRVTVIFKKNEIAIILVILDNSIVLYHENKVTFVYLSSKKILSTLTISKKMS